MRIILCLDKSNGMLFNNRRQSRDAELINDIFNNLGNSKVYITDFSKTIFENQPTSTYTSPEEVGEDYLFVENIDVTPMLDSVTEFVLYKWNRAYPGDFFFDVDLKGNGFKKIESVDFVGKSHEKITKEIWRR